MGSALDALNAPSSLTARRQAASSLPAFELPPPSSGLHFSSQSAPKYPHLSTNFPQQAQSSAINSLLTPPSNSASESSSTTSGLPGTTPNTQSVPILPYTPSFWQGTTPNGFHTGFTPQPWQGPNPLFPPRSMFSPSLGNMGRHNSDSPTVGESQGLPPPPYELSNISTFPTSLSTSSNGGHLGNGTQHQSVSNSLMQQSTRPPSQSPSVPAADGLQKLSYNDQPTSSAPPQSAYSYAGPSPVHQSPHLNGHGRLLPQSSHNSMTPTQQQNHFLRPPYPSFSLPAMPGPVMANVHSPSGPMSLVGNMQSGMLPFHSGNVANPQNMYGNPRSHSAPQHVANDRPFRCDQCPQSFNRNHDLKRHKRIHLAVKPFPCGHCDKSFSRKDALKRHILVKGCGKGSASDSRKEEPNLKSESTSDDAGDSPIINGQT